MKEKHKAAPKTECILPAGKSDGGDDAPIYNNGVNLFDQYTIFSKIGSGGMGVVYLAKDKRLDRFVSIKRLNHQAQTNPSLRKRFLQEARAVASLNHVHIVHIYALGEDSDGPYIVMEYVAGPANKAYAQNGGEADNPSVPNPPLTLEKYTSERGSLSADEAIGLMIKISSAIAYAHNCGVIHRDLKPSNILLDESNEPKIVDFGLARLIHGSTDFSKLTVPGEKLISLGYGAPEQEKDASFSDERSDVYGLGALLYFMLTGQNPRYFREQDVPVSLRELVVKSLAMDKEQRLPSATAFIDSLKEIQNRTRVETPTVKTTWRCKWCDAVNPVSTKFCAECGWDGRELCPECGAETFIGIQYCNSCGADIRSYENILNTIKKIKDDFSCHRYESVISGAGQVHGFEPAGQSGRRYLQEVQTLKESSEKSIALRKQVKEQISIELNAENYERARRFILQYRDLTGEPKAFAAEERELPEKTLKRDLGRVRRFILRRDWTTAAHLCDTLLESVAPNNENVLRLARLIRTRRTLRKCMCLFVLTLLPLSLYILSYPLSLRWTDQPMPKALAYFYAPARYLYSAGDSQIGALLNKYAKLTFPDYGKIRLSQDLQTESILQTVPLPENVQSQKDKFEKQLGELKTAQDAFELKWSDEYIRELNTLADKYRRDGDFNAWKLTTEDLKAFSGEQRFATTQNHTDIAPELLLLKQKYRKMKDRHTLALCRKVTTVYNEYINSLTDIQKGFMQNKNMSLAAAINDEICSARESAHFKQAKQMIDAAEQNRSGEPAAADSRIFEQSFADVKIHEVEDALLKLRNELEKANAIATENSEQCNRNYVLKLQQVKADYQQEGHYDGVLATEAENSRFRAERHLDESVVVDKDYQALHLLQTTTIEQLKTIKLVRAKKIISATENCAQSLGQLQKKFTVGGDMKSAAAIDSEIKSIRTAVDYLAAKQVLAPRPATKEQRSNNESE